MELRPRSGISETSETRATSLDRKSAGMNKVDDVTNEILINPLSSATGVTRGGKSPSRILPGEGGRIRTSIPLPRSESAGGAVRSPEGDPPRRRGQTRESGDAGERATPDRQPLAVAAIVGDSTVHPDEGAEFTLGWTNLVSANSCRNVCCGNQVRRLICEWLSWLLRMSRPGDETKVGSLQHRRLNHPDHHHRHLRHRPINSGGHLSPSLIANVRDSSTANGAPANSRVGPAASLSPARSASPLFLCRCPTDDAGTRRCCGAGVESLRSQLGAILAEVRCLTQKMRNDAANDELTSDWKFAAMVIDRLSFWTLTVYLVVVTVAVFGSVIRS